MDALGSLLVTVRTLLLLCVLAGTSQAAIYKTPNFTVNAPTPEFAKQVGTTAEQFRKELAVMWTGAELKKWSAPCPIRVKVGQIGAGGSTTFSFHNGEVFGWNMSIQGSKERILDSVLPHEITHTILACRFRQPLPRWADEGLCTLVEHESERRRQTLLLGDVMRTGKRIPLKALFSMKEYPSDMRDVMKLYAQGYSLVDYLVQQGGRETFMRFMHDALRHGSWDQALSAHYGVNTRDKLEQKWGKWVVAGSPRLEISDGNALALNAHPQEKTVVRGQSPDKSSAVAAPKFLRGNQLNGKQEAIPFDSSSQVASGDLGKGNAVSHQAARSRGQLSQPVFTWPANSQSKNSAKKNRSPLQLTREEFRSSKTPLSNKDHNHPYVGATKRNLFTP
ncbi:MAG: hypothetical protein JKY95_06165 [Planctomycetaceae bacterium]|nr:hypothetical protein [Planctomycetaceae bacterium]